MTNTDLLNAKVTVYFEGMIFHAFKEKESTHQAGIHTTISNHATFITIKEKGRQGILWPPSNQPAVILPQWIRDNAPLWLYVGQGDAALPIRGSANRFAPFAPSDPNSSARMLDFEGDTLYPNGLKIKPGVIAPLNIPQGIAYTVNSQPAFTRIIGKETQTPLGEEITTLSAIAIPSLTNNERLILRSEQLAEPIIDLVLNPNEKYEVFILHTKTTPLPIDESPAERENHFEEIYNAFEPVQPHFIIDFTANVPGPFAPPHSDPCFDSILGQHLDGFPW